MTPEELAAELEKTRADHLATVDQLNSALTEKSTLAALVAEREAAIAERDTRIGQASQQLQLVTGRYRDLVVAQPDVAPAKDFVSGNTLEEIDAAVERAKAVVTAIRGAVTPPAVVGAPPLNGGIVRQPPDYAALSAADKIKMGVQLQASR